MTDVLVRGVPEELLEALKRRAAQNNRSLQGELREILEEGARREPHRGVDAAELARRVKEKIAARHGGPFETDSADLVRRDRDSR